MRRRDVLAFAAGAVLAGPFAARAQEARIPRVGILSPHGPTVAWVADGIREGFRELGYIEGKTIQIEYRYAHGQFDRLPELASELVRLNVDVIVAVVTDASLAAKAATRTLPIVMVGVADPVGVGLVDSLARPGGNITGTSGMTAEIVGKQLQLIKEIDPSISRVAVLWNPANSAFQALQVREAEAAGPRLGVQLQFLAATAPDEFGAAFATMRREEMRALLILSDPVFVLHRVALVDFVTKGRLSAVSGFREFVETGGLAAYGPNYRHRSKRAALYVDKILKGAKPADLPIEQPANFDLMINLRTAKALGIEMPASILARADEVIE
jgi:putative tryptophan/tyrosine transport system substrate-binding protein